MKYDQFNPFPNKTRFFFCVCITSILKTLWDTARNKQFLLSLFGKLSAIFVKFKIIVFKLFQFGRSSLKFVAWERVKGDFTFAFVSIVSSKKTV